jgi:hypothetical protein
MMAKRIFIYLGCALILFFVYQLFLKKKKSDSTKQVEVINPKKHSEVFNKNINKVVDAYLQLKNAFVEADTNSIKLKTNDFINILNKIDTAELKKDTSSIYETVISTINDIRSNAESITKQYNIIEMRRDFSSLTDMMFPSFFYAIKYEGPTLYLQNCPMAFDDSVPANWISNSSEIMNPYLGKKHPKYQAGMLNCGEIKDSITIQ